MEANEAIQKHSSNCEKRTHFSKIESIRETKTLICTVHTNKANSE